jgi:hypothetical protein
MFGAAFCAYPERILEGELSGLGPAVSATNLDPPLEAGD